MSVSLEMQEHLEQQWAIMLNEGNDLRVAFLKGYAKLDVSGIFIHCEVDGDDVASGDDDEDSEQKFGNPEQIANLAVILSKDVGADIETDEISARPGSQGERFLRTLMAPMEKLKALKAKSTEEPSEEVLKEAEGCAELLTQIQACLVYLHHYLYLESKRNRNVVRGLIFVPGTN